METRQVTIFEDVAIIKKTTIEVPADWNKEQIEKYYEEGIEDDFIADTEYDIMSEEKIPNSHITIEFN